MNTLLETAGQIAAIIICLFTFVFIILAVAFNLAMAFGMSWLAEKIQVIKMLRPTVDSVNKATESALNGFPAEQEQNNIVHAAASIPATVHNLEKKVDRSTDKVADAVIEFRARTVQAKTILKAFFLPGSEHRKQERAAMELRSSGEQIPTQERPTSPPAQPPLHKEEIQHAAMR